MKKLSNEGIAIIVLAVLLVAAISIGFIRRIPKGKIELEPSTTISEKIDLNKADADELMELHGIGPGLASRIIAYRDTHGLFSSLESLLNVPGIGSAKLEDIKPYLEVP
ncbi:helix-hairpin-helix domain-containing protein [bacterium]|nr:helix-hairpin-helix domain-containing protein [bacterium]